jgi:ADP-ribose pyrophosphatase YjhB (NUDIX family)
MQWLPFVTRPSPWCSRCARTGFRCWCGSGRAIRSPGVGAAERSVGARGDARRLRRPTSRHQVDVREIAHLEQLETRSDPGRDPHGRTVATAYLGWSLPWRTPGLPDHAAWHDVAALPPMAFDHLQSSPLRWSGCARSSRTRISGFALAPAEFTISQLRDIYKAGARPRRRSHQLAPRPDPARATRANRPAGTTDVARRSPSDRSSVRLVVRRWRESTTSVAVLARCDPRPERSFAGDGVKRRQGNATQLGWRRSRADERGYVRRHRRS